MSRPIYLIVYHSQLFAAHWSLWIPVHNTANGETGHIGKIVHVVGNPSEGYSLEFKRNYDLLSDTRTHSVILLSHVDAAKIVDVPGEGTYFETVTPAPMDELEEIAVHVPPPPAGLRKPFSSGLKTRLELKNCQTWLRELVVAAIEGGIFSHESLQVLDQAPKN